MEATISDFRSCDAFRLSYDELNVVDPMKTDYNGIYEILPGEFDQKVENINPTSRCDRQLLGESGKVYGHLQQIRLQQSVCTEPPN